MGIIHKEERKFFLYCDKCNKEVGPYSKFIDAIKAKTPLDWVCVKFKEQWIDLCKECK